jgi:hypothetical protein
VARTDDAWAHDFGHWWRSDGVSMMLAVSGTPHGYIADVWLAPNGEAVPDLSGDYLTEAKRLDPPPTHWKPRSKPPLFYRRHLFAKMALRLDSG